MLKYNIKYSIIFSIVLTFLTMAVMLVGCTDNLVNTVEIPDAEVDINGELIFKPLVTTEVQTRTRAEAPGKNTKG